MLMLCQRSQWENLNTALSGVMLTCVHQEKTKRKGNLNMKFQVVVMKRSMIMGQHNPVCARASLLRNFMRILMMFFYSSIVLFLYVLRSLCPAP